MDETWLRKQDAKLLQSYQRTWEAGARAAGRFLACAPGCHQCCLGVFEITSLDARRLLWGLKELAGGREKFERASGFASAREGGSGGTRLRGVGWVAAGPPQVRHPLQAQALLARAKEPRLRGAGRAPTTHPRPLPPEPPRMRQQSWTHAHLAHRHPREALRQAFPGCAITGKLSGSEEAREDFFQRFAQLPCPVLDPGTGLCLLYPFRLPPLRGAGHSPPAPPWPRAPRAPTRAPAKPDARSFFPPPRTQHPYLPSLSCRSFGLPCHIGGSILPPCSLNFQGACREEIQRATVEFDRERLEDQILQALGEEEETIIAAALSLSET